MGAVLRHGNLSAEFRAEYVELIYRIGQRYVKRSKANHKGLAEVARSLGVAYPTLKSRLRMPGSPGAAKQVSAEQLLAARYLFEHPTDGFNRAADLVPEPPRIPETTSDKIVAILTDSPRPLNAAEVVHMLGLYFGDDTGRPTVQSRLAEMVGEEVPEVRRTTCRRKYEAIR